MQPVFFAIFDLAAQALERGLKPLFDPRLHSEDFQRCTDVALDAADIQFKFNRLQLKPRLNITAWPNTIRYQDIEETESEENLVVFKAYTYYGNFINQAEDKVRPAIVIKCLVKTILTN